MVNKKLVVVAFLLALAVIFWVASNSTNNEFKSEENILTGKTIENFDGEEVKINMPESSFEFTGGKVVGPTHIGTFESWEGSVYLDNGEVVGIKGIAQATSIKTENSRVNAHLQTDDFFYAAEYPEVKFTSTNIDLENEEITGILEIKNQQKELTIPANFEEGKISGEFSFDSDEFFKYDILIIEIGISFEFVY